MLKFKDGKEITAQDVDRLLGLADQFLEDWENGMDGYAGAHPEDVEEVKMRRAEWDTLRPALVALPVLLSSLAAIAEIPDPETGDRGPMRQARHIAKCAIASTVQAPSLSNGD